MSIDKNLLIDIWLMALLTDRLVGELLDDTPLSADEFAIYGLIVDLAPITAADLVRCTGLSPTTVSGVLGRCEARRELRRVPNPADRRSNLLELTDVGMAVYAKAVPHLGAALADLHHRLGPAMHRIRGTLEELDGALREILDVGERPYELDGADATPLTSDQRIELDRFAEWLRHRDE